MDNVVAPNHLSVVTSPEVTLIPNNSLLTETPEEGRQQPDIQETFHSPHATNQPALPESIRAAIDAQTSSIVKEAQEEPVEIK